jgi:hypothetical protein
MARSAALADFWHPTGLQVRPGDRRDDGGRLGVGVDGVGVEGHRDGRLVERHREEAVSGSVARCRVASVFSSAFCAWSGSSRVLRLSPRHDYRNARAATTAAVQVGRMVYGSEVG